MSSFDSTPPPPTMVDCPKCGFNQPKDQYCAKCGVDMHKVPRNPATALLKLLKKPAALAALGVFAVIVTVAAVRTIRHNTPALSQEDARSRELRARVSLQSQNNFAAAGATAENSAGNSAGNSARNAARDTSGNSPENSADNSYDTRESASSAPSEFGANASATSAEAEAPGAVTSALKGATDTKSPTDSKTGIDSATAGLQVAFAWAEVSREWLQAMGATSPGPHRVSDLDARLRESVGGYKILAVNRQKITEKQEPIVLSHGTNLNVRFETVGATENSLTGSIQPDQRAPDGAVRSVPPVAISIDKGQGTIVTLGAAPIAATAPGTTVTEIVLLILPRWGTNPKP